jgi:hypothetical protein
MASDPSAVKRDGRSAAIAAMPKPDGDRYSAHDVDFFEHETVAAT